MTSEISHERRETRAAHVKERIYLTFTTLAVVVAIAGHDQHDAGIAFRTVVVSVLGTLLAVFTADVISHMVIHESAMTKREMWEAARASFGALTAVTLPLLFLIAAMLGWWTTSSALMASAIALLVALVAIGYIAVRRLALRWWQRLIALGAEALLGLAVVGLQVLAKS